MKGAAEQHLVSTQHTSQSTSTSRSKLNTSPHQSPWATAAVLPPTPATADPTAAATAALYVLLHSVIVRFERY